jgi:hypothetical protein
MELVIGFLAGILAALFLGGIGIYLFLREDNPVVVPDAPPSSNEIASVTVILLESFLNQQLAQLMVTDAAPSTAQALGPVKFKLNGASLDLQPESRARLTVQLTATAWNLNLNLRPVTAFTLLPQKGRARIIVTEIELHGVKIPRKWVDSFIQNYVTDAEAKLNQSLVQLERDTNVELFELETSEDMLILKFRSM